MLAVFIWDKGDVSAWRAALQSHLPDLDLRTPDEIDQLDQVEFAMTWMPPIGELKRYPALRAIFSIGAGVSHILRDKSLPPGVPIVRLSDDTLLTDMTTYMLHWIIHLHRGFHLNRLDAQRAIWRRQQVPENAARRVGILGMGVIGRALAPHLVNLRFDVAGWSRTRKTVAGVRSFHGDAQLRDFLHRTDILACLLPHTPATVDLLNSQRLSWLPRGASLINAGRGEIVVDADLLRALDEGHLSAAVLDVFREEPLPSDHKYWTHPRIMVTPHAAAPTNTPSGATAIASNIARIQRGALPEPIVDTALGY